MDKGLNFGHQVKKVILEANAMMIELRTMDKFKWGCDAKMQTLLQVGCIRSTLEYGADNWGSLTSRSNLHKVETIQNTTAKYMNTYSPAASTG